MSEIPAVTAAAPAPASIKEALNQRLEKYKETKQSTYNVSTIFYNMLNLLKIKFSRSMTSSNSLILDRAYPRVGSLGYALSKGTQKFVI